MAKCPACSTEIGLGRSLPPVLLTFLPERLPEPRTAPCEVESCPHCLAVVREKQVICSGAVVARILAQIAERDLLPGDLAALAEIAAAIPWTMRQVVFHVPELFRRIAPRAGIDITTIVPGYIDAEIFRFTSDEAFVRRGIAETAPRLQRWRSLRSLDLVDHQRVPIGARGAAFIPPTTGSDAASWQRRMLWLKQGTSFRTIGTSATFVTMERPSGIRLRGWSKVRHVLAGLEMFVPDPSQLPSHRVPPR